METPLDINQIPYEPAQRREWIKYQLGVRGYTLTSLGAELGVTRNAVSNALLRPYPRVEAAIGQVLGVAPHFLWPERYDSAGQPNRRPGPPKGCVAGNTTRAITPAQA